MKDGRPDLKSLSVIEICPEKSDIKPRKLLNITKFLIFILAISAFTAGCGDDKEKQGIQPPADVEQEISQFSLAQTRGGKTRWRLNADLATFLDSDQIRLAKTVLVIFDDSNRETLNVQGQQGEVDQRTNDIKIAGNVEGTYSSGGKFFAQEVYWSESREKIYTRPGVEVKILYKDTEIIGEEMEANPKLETASLKNIKGVTRAEEKIDEE